MEAPGVQDVVQEKDPTRFRAHAPRSVGETKLQTRLKFLTANPRLEPSLTHRKQTIATWSNSEKLQVSHFAVLASDSSRRDAKIHVQILPSAPAHLTPLRAQTSIIFSHSRGKSLRRIGGIS